MKVTIEDQDFIYGSICAVSTGPISSAIRRALVAAGIEDSEIVNIAIFDGTYMIQLKGGEHAIGDLPEELRDYYVTGVATPYEFNIDLSY